MSIAAREANVPLWSPLAWGFVVQARKLGYREIPALLVAKGQVQVKKGMLCIRRQPDPTGNHIDIATENWDGGKGRVIGANVSNKITPRPVQLETHNRWSYTHFIEITVEVEYAMAR